MRIKGEKCLTAIADTCLTWGRDPRQNQSESRGRARPPNILRSAKPCGRWTCWCHAIRLSPRGVCPTRMVHRGRGESRGNTGSPPRESIDRPRGAPRRGTRTLSYCDSISLFCEKASSNRGTEGQCPFANSEVHLETACLCARVLYSLSVCK